MTTYTKVKTASISFIILSGLAFLSVSAMAFYNPQSVMDLVKVDLPNTDPLSSIRGVYGGVGLSIFISLIFLLKKNIQLALGFLTLIWGMYALSRFITICVNGSLGSFGTQWLITESILCLTALVLWYLQTDFRQHANN